MRRRRGLALIVVAGVLGVVTVLAVCFVTMARLERSASQRRIHQTQALLLARSGIEDALARLGMGQDALGASNRYGGEDWDGNGQLSVFEADQEFFRRTGAGTAADTMACPVGQAMRPSFFVRVPGSDNPETRSVDTRQRGCSGVLAGKGNQYALKISEEGGFYVNGGALNANDVNLSGGPDCRDPAAGYNVQLYRMFGALCGAIDVEGGSPLDSWPVGTAHGQSLITLRPAGGWTSYEQIRDVVLGGDPVRLEALKPYITFNTWVDRSVIQPNLCAVASDGTPVLLAGAALSAQAWCGIRTQHQVNPQDATSRAPAFQQWGGVVTGRAPVPLAWARTRKPALVALLAGLKGYFLRGDGTNLDFGDVVSRYFPTQLSPAPLAAGNDLDIAVSAVLTSTSALSTWQEWSDFCDTIPFPPTAVTGEAQAKRDLLKANFNPNSDLNKFNPNASRFKSMDKQDLVAYSTEFSLFPTQARTLESLGRVLAREGRLAASRTIRATLPPPSVAKITTQKEFVCTGLGRLDCSGDEVGPWRMPGAADFLGPSRGSAMTWGHRIDMRSLYPGSFLDADDADGTSCRGVGLQTYPEPCVYTGSGDRLTINPAAYDGSLMLATVETRDNQYYTASVPTMDMKMLARFDDAFDLELADSSAADGKDCVEDTALVLPAELGRSLLHANKPNTLVPDGGYSEKDRTPAWYSAGNVQGFRGLMSVWVKPNFPYRVGALGFPPQAEDRDRVWASLFNTAGARSDDSSTSQAWAILWGEKRPTSNLGDYYQPGLTAFFEIDRTNAGGGNERPNEHTYPLFWLTFSPRRWRLVTFSWNFQAANADDGGELVADAGVPASLVASANLGPYGGNQNNAGDAEDITMDDAWGRHLLCLGYQFRNRGERLKYVTPGSGADATFDELAVYDFGAACGTVTGPTARLAGERFKEGRYYKGREYTNLADAPGGDQAASYLSPPFPLPKGSRLLKAFWTWHRPNDAALAAPAGTYALDYAEVALLKPGSPAEYLWPASSGAASRSRSASGWTPDRQDWEVNRILPAGGFRAQVVFRRDAPTASIAPDTPLLDTPILDDLGFVYQATAAITGWKEGE